MAGQRCQHADCCASACHTHCFAHMLLNPQDPFVDYPILTRCCAEQAPKVVHLGRRRAATAPCCTLRILPWGYLTPTSCCAEQAPGAPAGGTGVVAADAVGWLLRAFHGVT